MFINKALISFAKGSENKILKSILSQLLITFLASLNALCISILINRAIGNKYMLSQNILIVLFIIISVLLMSRVLSKINIKLVTSAGVSIKDNVRTKIIQKLFLLGPGYSSNIRTGALTSIFTTRVEWLMNYYTKYMPVVLSAVINSIFFIVFLTYIDFYVGITAFISVLMMLFIPMLFFGIMKEKGEKEWDRHAKYYSECLDGIQGMINLKSFNADKKYVNDIKEYGEEYRKSIMEHLRITIIEGTFSEFFVRVGTALTIAILGWRCVYGFVEKEWLIMAFFSVGATFSPMLSLINAWHLGFQGVSGSYSIDEFLKIESKDIIVNRFIPKNLMQRDELEKYMDLDDDVEKIQSLRNSENHISFDDVYFKYLGESENAVENISIDIEKGKIVAIVGPSGAGKSTLAGLLIGFYRPSSGSIRLGNKVLENDTAEFFVENISAVWQNNHLFSGTIYDNIRIGRWNATQEEIYDVARKAMIHDIIMSLPDKYDTNISELGGKFSTGERQRIAIARAFLKDTSVLIFDEATSSIDRENEMYIQKAFENLKGDRAIFIIAHRLSTIKMADEICYIENGKIINRGSHKELLANSASYRRLLGGID